MKRPIRYALRLSTLVVVVACLAWALTPDSANVGPYVSALSSTVAAEMVPVVCPHSKCANQGGPSTCEFSQTKACLGYQTDCRTVRCQ